MADLNVALIVRLLDQVTSPAQKVRNAIRVIGNATKDFRRDFAKAFKSDFSTGRLEAAIERSENRISKARGRLMGAAAMAVTLGAPVIVAGNFEEKMIDFAILAEISTEQAAELEQKLDDLRKKTGKGKGELLDGLSAYVGKGLSLDSALASLEATGVASVATKSLMDEMANSGFSIMDNLDVDPSKLKKAFDIMATSGKEGSFELAAMARKFPEITAGAKSLKMEGIDAVASLSAALQVAMKAAGSEDQAATNLTNFMGKITAPDTVKKFKDFGVNVEKEMEIALKRGTDPLEHMLLVIREMTGGDAFKMGELFADKQVLDFLRAAIPNLEEFQRIRDKAAGADGILDKDAARVLKGFNAQWKLLKDSVTSALGASGALLPIMTDLMSSTRGVVEAVNSWTKANPELTATIVKGGAALLAFGIGTRLLGFGLALMSNGLLRTAALFFKFNDAGKNVSVVGRAFRATRWSASRLWRTGVGLSRFLSKPMRWGIQAIKWSSLVPTLHWARFVPKLSLFSRVFSLSWTSRLVPMLRWAKFIPMLALASRVFPFKWTTRLIPMLKWATFLPPKLALASLIIPLSWTGKLLPSFAAPLARFAGFRTAASAEISGLSRHVSRQSTAMSRSLSKLRWSAFGASLMMWQSIQSMPDSAEKLQGFQKRNRDAMDGGLRNVPGISQLITGYEKLFEKVHGKPPPGAGESPVVGQTDGEQTLGPRMPDPGAADHQDALRAEIARLTTEIASIKDGPMANTLRTPLRDQVSQIEAELDLSLKASAKQDRAADGPDQSKPRPRPPIGNDKISGAVQKALKPVANSIREASRRAPETSQRPRTATRLPVVRDDLRQAVSDALKPVQRRMAAAGTTTPNVSLRPRGSGRLPPVNAELAKAVSDALNPLAARLTARLAPSSSSRPRSPQRLPTLNADLSKAVADALKPLSNSLQNSMRQSEVRLAQTDYKAPQPNVDVISTFQSNNKIEVGVNISMPVTIKREQTVNNAAIAKEAGRKVGADTERAVRRGLDDAANAQ